MEDIKIIIKTISTVEINKMDRAQQAEFFDTSGMKKIKQEIEK